MCKFLAILAFIVVSVGAQTTCNAIGLLGPSVGGLCPSGYTVVTSGDCCASDQVVTCADKTNANGVNECPGLKSYCNNSQYKTLMTQQCAKTCGFCTGTPSTCADLVNPSTGRSECAANKSRCNDSVYRDMMKTQCPKTCGYCK
ncbi:ShKT domain-containing protein [Caenorhabditis elegans]|uniref:ShKT domain-containing protein n=1 Tax=Caenorhabditis elegans TaxID=6239 RepID=O17815_CAEEL|nr:ShKT domain-containing protein [Caenorhabditis elegans]CAB02944.1 ShKT domain-containing protein [Caenorhabditis elegans]|eukprot:NP_496658.1 Uncharacterized protein CELE_F15A4.6 [Caenorhabditis elegans]